MATAAAPDVIDGKAGETWTNNTDKVLYQYECQFRNSCGLCVQFAGQVGPWWPLPLHRACNCRNLPVMPGSASAPFVDFRKEIAALEPDQQARLAGDANWKLIRSGTVEWGDVVHGRRILNFREVVANQGLTVRQMRRVGISKPVAERAYAVTHTAEVATAERSRKALMDILKSKGLSYEEIRDRVADSLARRVGLGGGEAGPLAVPPVPGPGGYGPAGVGAVAVAVAVGPAMTAAERQHAEENIYQYLNAYPPVDEGDYE
jgi:hypothetical protein